MYIKLLQNCLLDSIYGSFVIRDMNGIPKDKNKIASKFDIDNGTYWPNRAHTMI